MKFSTSIALKNMIRRPVRTALMCLIVLILSFSALLGGYLIISLQNGLDGYRARLGADIVVVPSSAQGHGTVDNVLLQGITGNYYIPGSSLEKLENIKGIEKMTAQFYLTSAKASCCSSRVQIIGFDPETDFTVMPWLSSQNVDIADGDIIIGGDIAYPADGSLRFYGESYHVASQLEKTGTGLDNAVFTNRSTITKMARSAADTLEREALKGIDPGKAVSCVLIKVKDGYDPQALADDINIHISKVRASSSLGMIGSVSEGLENVSGIISIITIGMCFIAAELIIAVFTLMINNRKKEFAVMRAAGASKGMILFPVAWEAAFISIIGSLFGIIVSLLFITPLEESIRSRFSLPFLQPDIYTLSILMVGALIIPVIIAVLSAVISALRIAGNETGILLREDA